MKNRFETTRFIIPLDLISIHIDQSVRSTWRKRSDSQKNFGIKISRKYASRIRRLVCVIFWEKLIFWNFLHQQILYYSPGRRRGCIEIKFLFTASCQNVIETVKNLILVIQKNCFLIYLIYNENNNKWNFMLDCSHSLFARQRK